MKTAKIITASLLSFIVFFSTIIDLKASHSEGADISYVCLGNDSFLITLNFYRDCRGISAPTSASVNISSATCGINQSLNLNQLGSGVEVTPVCLASLPNTACNGGSLPGVELYVYTGIFHFPAPCPDWVISYDLCCRNDQITTLASPGSEDLYIQSTMTNIAGLCNNSPTFTSLPVPYLCANQPFNYNHGAVDVDGDSLVYSVINPLNNAGTNIPYSGSFNPNSPMNLTGPFVFDSQTGQMTFTPNGVQVAVITVLVQEYRNNVLIGSTMRDIQVVVLACTNNQPVSTNIQNSVGGVLLGGRTLQVCPGENISFQFSATDVDVLNVLTMTTNVASSIPGANVTFSGTGNSITGTFIWIPSALDTGLNVLTVTVTDGACPIIGINISSFLINVLDGTYAGPDLKYCVAGGPVQLEALGGSAFSWTPSIGLSDTTIGNPLASPPVTTTYIVTSNLDTLCNNTDTVTVFVVPDFILAITPDDTICRHSSTQLNVNADPLYAPFNYSWTPTDFISSSTISNPIVTPISTTTYVAAVTSDTGCTIRDSVTVYIQGVGPIVEITADKNNVCPGDTIQLTGEIYSLECGPTIIGCTSAPTPRLYGDSTAANFSGTPLPGLSEDSRFQALYLASDLIAQGFSPGTITRIGLEIGSKASTGVYQNLTFKLGCTSNENLSTTAWEPLNTIVYGPVAYATSIGLNNFGLSTPFDWDGRSNLVLEICYNNPALSNAGGNDQLLSMSKSYTASMRSFDNGTDGCVLNPTFTYTEIPRTTFYMCDPNISNYTLSWTPVNGLSDPSIINPTVVVNGLQTYSLFVTDSLCDGSNFINLNIDTAYGVNIVPDNPGICLGDSIALNVQLLGNPPTSILSCAANPTFTTCSTSSNTRQVGSGATITGSGTPYEGFWEDGRVQFLYRATELVNAGLTNSGTLTALQFFVSLKGSTQPFSGYTIKIGCTSLNTLSSTGFSNVPLTTVYGPRSYPTISGWNNHLFDTPYNWDGTSNLLVEICFNNSSYTDDDDVAYTTTPGFNSVLYAFTDGAVGCSLTGPTISSNRPNTRFVFCDAPTGTTSIAWTPFNNITSTSGANTVVFPTVTTSYKVDYTFVNGCTRSDSVSVQVSNLNPSTGPDTTICRGETVQLNVSGGDTYLWDSLPGLSCYNCPNPLATPSVSTTYIVHINGAGGSCVESDSVVIIVADGPFIRFSNDSLFCFLDSFRLDAGAGFASYNWNIFSTTSSILVTIPGEYSVTVTDVNGCQNSDTINLIVGTAPAIDLGSDIAVCAGDSVELNAGSSYAAYFWSNSSVDSSITVFITGNYSLTVADTTNCPSSDSVFVEFLSPPTGSLGNDTTLCPGATLVLIAGTSDYTYFWSNSLTDTSIIVTSGANYSVTISDGSGCTSTDTIAVVYSSGNPVDLGSDIYNCNNQTILLDAGAGYISYSWAPIGSTRVISVSLAGNYSVTVVNQNSCVSSDTIVVIDGNPIIDLGSDRNICAGETVLLDAGAGFIDYTWNNGLKTQTITAALSGTYSVTVLASNTCSATDAIVVTVHPLPIANLGPDASVCQGFNLSPGSFASYSWSGGTTDPTLSVNVSGDYSVTVTDNTGCSNFDSITVTVFEIEIILDDHAFCIEDSATLILGPSGYASYLWSTTETTQDILVTQEGVYALTVEDQSGCVAADTFFVTVVELVVTATANPQSIGEGQSSTLNADVTNGSGAYQFSWTPTITLNDPTTQSPIATPSTNTTYTVEVIDLESECVGTDTVFVQVENRFAIPTAFAPNGSVTENHIFKPLTTGLVTIKEFKIYNRWGQLVSDNVNGWDGTFEGKEQPMGSYVYFVVIELANGQTEKKSNVFSLVR